MNFYLGIDCGGTFVKAALISEKGLPVIVEKENVGVISENAGYAERDPVELWKKCCNVIKRIVEKTDPKFIKAISISAQGKGVFLLDKDQKPLGRAILSSDQRALGIVKEWEKEGILEKLYPLTLQTLWTGHPVSILRWIKQYQVERYNQIGTVLMSHDYLRFCLTGKLHCEVTNISESNLYNMKTGSYDKQLAELFYIPEIIDYLPPIIMSDEIVGTITKEAAKETGLLVTTPVVGGLFDVVSTALCSGINDENTLNVVLGTWSVVSGITDYCDSRQTVPFVYGKYVKKDKFIIHEASPTSAGNLEWFIQQWNLSYEEINQQIAELPPAQSSVFFMPFLYGSNAKLGMKAGFYGIQSHHCQAHLLQAIYEGVLFSLMNHLERMKLRFPNVNALRVTGGAVKSRVWMQMLADLTGFRLEIPDVEETGCVGAAIIAMHAMGSLEYSITPYMQIIDPNPTHFSAYQRKYQSYQKLIKLLNEMD